ncbi:MAG: family ATPase [Bacteroidetes bacterium]|jgi:energy-coupling factor transporter ATP-binding protein EcfA2|nr:family ATPase [Bacteroidota bacterium]
MSTIEINPQFEQVLSFVNQTSQLIFLTGKAGTGKTTLLKYIRENTYKQIAVVAPTGVAAINAGGTTIHSFFQFPFTPFLPSLKETGELNASKTNLPTLKYNLQRLSIFRNLELLVIDEVSMVRADLLDQIDITLRQTRKKWHLPFGGVQVMLIGDMYQLPPVVQPEEWRILNEVYQSPYFFDSLVVKNNPPVFIELTKIYRQNETRFIDLLNKVRNNILDQEGLELLNSHFKANITKEDYRENITLTTHNRKADEINLSSLKDLPGKEYSFKCKVDKIFSEKNYPADEILVLKKGTRVMFLKNNTEKNYYNGKIGVISFIDEEKIKVKCEEDHHEIDVQREAWTNVAYNVDKSTKHIEEEVLGTFNQFPLRLAWAITIHKSQGLTFDKLIIDAAEAFSAGQVYVALSRCRGLEGLTLSSKISPQSLLNDRKIVNFSTTKQNNEQVNTIFSGAQRNYIKTVLTSLFDFTELFYSRQEAGGIIQLFKTKITGDGAEWSETFFKKIDALHEVSTKFKNQLSALVDAALSIETDLPLQARLKQASVYFETEIKKCLDDLKNCTLRTESKEAADELNAIFQLFLDTLFQKHSLISSIGKGFIFSDFVKRKLKLIYPDFKLNVYASAKNTKVSADVKYPKLYRELILLRDEICNDEGKPIYMVANNKTLTELTNFLPTNENHLLKVSGFGQAKVDAFGDRFLKIIRAFMLENDLSSNMDELPVKKTKKPKKEKSEEEKIPTREQSFLLFKKGMKIEEIAQQRGFTVTTIEGHLAEYVQSGELKIDYLVSREKQKTIRKALENFSKEKGLSEIKKTLPNDISFGEIKCVLADKLREEG